MSKGLGESGFTVLDVDIRFSDITVGTAITQIVHRNPNRLRLDVRGAITNTDNVYLRHHGYVTTAVYDEVVPVGEWITITDDDKRERFAVSGTASQAITIVEYIHKGGVPSRTVLKPAMTGQIT
jgi:hypothetical protein